MSHLTHGEAGWLALWGWVGVYGGSGRDGRGTGGRGAERTVVAEDKGEGCGKEQTVRVWLIIGEVGEGGIKKYRKDTGLGGLL